MSVKTRGSHIAALAAVIAVVVALPQSRSDYGRDYRADMFGVAGEDTVYW